MNKTRLTIPSPLVNLYVRKLYTIFVSKQRKRKSSFRRWSEGQSVSVQTAIGCLSCDNNVRCDSEAVAYLGYNME